MVIGCQSSPNGVPFFAGTFKAGEFNAQFVLFEVRVKKNLGNVGKTRVDKRLNEFN